MAIQHTFGVPLTAFRSGVRHVWGYAAIFAWSDLVLDQSRKPVS